jgi:pimeloyl-ACP methyl ester carboxylesterase
VAIRRRGAADHREPPCRLVSFAATDGIELSGLLYEPEPAASSSGRAMKRALVYMHGTGGSSIFDSKRTNLLAQELVARGIAFLPFNNRGAHLLRRLKSTRGTRTKSVDGGAAHERIRDCVFDIDGAAAFLRERGYGALSLAGHSTGANKIAVYDHYQPRNPFQRYVLLAGGDDTGMTYGQLGGRRFEAALTKARAMLAAKRGSELVPPALSPTPMSWRAFFDMNDPDGDYNVFPFREVLRGPRLSKRKPFRYITAITKPSLYIYGDLDPYTGDDFAASMKLLGEIVAPRRAARIAIIKGAEHGYAGHERELGELMAEFLGTPA